MNPTVLFLCILGLVCLSAFFSGSEMALSSCNRLRMENLRDEGSKRAAAVVEILDHFDRALSAILIGNNLVNIGASSLVSVLVILLSGSDKYTWIGTLLLTIVIIIFGETIPKITAKQSANRYSLRVARPVRLLTILLTPVIWVVVGLNWLLTFWLKEEKEDLSTAATISSQPSLISMASTSTRAVMTSMAEISEKSMAERSSSDWSSSRTSSSSAVSMIDCSSSTASSASSSCSPFMPRVSSAISFTTSQTTGFRAISRKFIA